MQIPQVFDFRLGLTPVQKREGVALGVSLLQDHKCTT